MEKEKKGKKKVSREITIKQKRRLAIYIEQIDRGLIRKNLWGAGGGINKIENIVRDRNEKWGRVGGEGGR